ncbi:hypothetical protein ASZ78_016574 [Callipepla squamata]|uniref:Protein kinase domain-containing protein n=1 Tax=Callipepla squamata TaxID=9009 RepID=A0A226MLM5_CALSU|nr:hypothetical protein ASZ78_016574 [Callipepla squamata]
MRRVRAGNCAGGAVCGRAAWCGLLVGKCTLSYHTGSDLRDVSSVNDLLRLSCALAEACPRASAAFGKLDFNKCQVLYIDYGNSEIINRSEIVEIPENLQYPSVAKRYRLWGLQLPANQNLNTFDQGKKFLGSLVFEKAIKIRQKAKQKDGVIIVQAECEKVDIGEEVAKAGFAEKSRIPGSSDSVEMKDDDVQNQRKKMKAPSPPWVNKAGRTLCNHPRELLGSGAAAERNEVFAGNRMFLTKERKLTSAPVFNRSLACMGDQNLAVENGNFEEEKETLRKENVNLLRRQKELELEVECLKSELKDERDELIIKRNGVQQNLYSAVKEFILEVDQLFICERSNALQGLSVSLEMVYGQVCEVSDSEDVFQQFFQWKHAKMEEFVYVRNNTDAALQVLTDLFSSILKCFDLTSEVSSDSEEAPGNVDEALKDVELSICRELKTDLTEQDEKEKGIIRSAYSEVMHKVRQEQNLITVIQKTYSASVEFKEQAEKWMDRRPNIDNLLSIKKDVKSLKAQLRWKLTEKNNLEESDDYSELEIKRIKEEIAVLRNKLLQEIYKEREEYEKLAYLVRKWFPELPLIYPEAGILSYMNSGGLLSHSLERDLLDAEPMKKLSTKRPLVCSEIQDQKVLLKETLKVMKGVAQGLQILHGANIVHGSLHGNNIFAVNRKEGIVGDFDFSKSEEQRAAADTMVIGTLSLVSPELKMGQPASPASDMYAYGCLLFWLCVQNQEFVIKEDGTPEVDVVDMDDKVKSLILNLFSCDRLTAEQVLRDDCFLLVDAVPVPSQLGEEHKPCEEHDSEKKDEEEDAVDAVNSEKNAVNPTQ